jgi:hypothetical protein
MNANTQNNMLAMVFARIHQEALFANATLAIQEMLQPQMHAQVQDGSRYTFDYNLQLLARELQGSLFDTHLDKLYV